MAAKPATRGAGKPRSRRVVQSGLAIALILAALAAGWYRHDQLARAARNDSQLYQQASSVTAAYALNWFRCERSGEPLPACEFDGFTCLGDDFHSSPELQTSAPCLIVIYSSKLPGTRGRFVGFADGTSRFVDWYELKAVRESDAAARLALRCKPADIYWPTAAEQN